MKYNDRGKKNKLKLGLIYYMDGESRKGKHEFET